MNNLKRILSLALASVMVMGMMVTGASAAKFTDAEDITHTAAVDVMVALGIINGMEGNTFQPNGDVTRAQMAKMITVAVNGKDPKLGKPTTSTFTDSANHWALEYIEYCANLGIIGGKGNGIFDPEGKVTAAEAAKMILVALGFDADVFQLVGANWSQNTITLASNLLVGDDVNTAEPLNLFAGLTGVTANTPLSRDQAAQLIYNGINSNTVKMALTGVTGGTLTGLLGGASGQTPTYEWSLTGDSLLESKFNAEVKTAVMTSAKYTKATKTAEAYWTYKIGDGSYIFAEDVSDLFRQNARVIYRKLSGNRINVLAITAANNGVVETCAFGDLYSNSTGTTLNGYDLAVKSTNATTGEVTYYTVDDLPVYMYLNTAQGTLDEVKKGTAEESTSYTTKDYDTAQLIDHNGDGRIDCVVVTEVKHTTVGGIRPNYIQLRGVTANVMLASNNVPEDLVVGDYVTYITNPETGVITVEKAEIVNGTLAATMDAKAEEYIVDSVRVNGTWYTVYEKYSTIKGFVGSEVNLVLVAGYVVDGEKVTTSTSSSDVVMAVAQAEKETENKTTVNGSTKYLEIRVLKADNTTEDLKVTKVNGAEVSEDSDYTKVLYTYSNDSSAAGCVTLKPYTPVIEGDKIGGDGEDKNNPVANWDFDAKSEASFTVNGGQIGTYRINADGTFFVMATKDGANKYAALKGSDIAKWYSQTPYAATTSVVYADRSTNGFIYAQTGAIILAEEAAIPGATGQALYHGFVTGNARYTIENRTGLIEVTVWNGTENVLVKAKTVVGGANKDAETNIGNSAQADTKLFTVGTLVSYLDNGDGTASELDALTETVNAVKAWDGESVIKFYDAEDESGETAELTIDNKTTILFMDGTTGEGVANGNIVLGDWVDAFDHTKGQYANVLYFAISEVQNANDHVDVLILETNSRIGAAAPTTEKPYEIFGAAETTTPPEEGGEDEPVVDNGMTDDEIKALDEGVYAGGGEDISDVKDAISAEDIENLIFFVYTAKAANTDCVLKVGTTDGGEDVYTETLSNASAAKHYFVMDKRVSSDETPIKDGAKIEMTAGTPYYAEISNSDFKVTFTIDAQGAITVTPAAGAGE